MMFISFWFAGRWFLLAGCIFAAGIGCAVVFQYPLSGIGDLATWVGAFGAFAAFGGAIYIATRDASQQREEALTRAHVVAARIEPQLKDLIAQLSMFSARLIFGRPYKLTPAEISRSFLPPRDLNISTEQIMALAPLPNKCAHRLAHAIGLLDALARDVSSYVELTKTRSDPLDENIGNEWSRNVLACKNLFEMVRRECTLAALVHAPQPDGNELHGNDA